MNLNSRFSTQSNKVKFLNNIKNFEKYCLYHNDGQSIYYKVLENIDKQSVICTKYIVYFDWKNNSNNSIICFLYLY